MCSTNRKKKIKNHLGDEMGTAFIRILAQFRLGDNFEMTIFNLEPPSIENGSIELIWFKISKSRIHDFPSFSRALQEISDIKSMVFLLDTESDSQHFVIKTKKLQTNTGILFDAQELDSSARCMLDEESQPSPNMVEKDMLKTDDHNCLRDQFGIYASSKSPLMLSQSSFEKEENVDMVVVDKDDVASDDRETGLQKRSVNPHKSCVCS